METVSIGCRLPNGYTLEVGLQTTVRGGPHDGLISQVSRLDNYQRVTLLGTNATFRKTRLRMPATLTPEPYINTGVPKAVWEQWKKEHPNAWAIKQGHIFEVKPGAAEAKAASLDSMSKPLPLAPLDPTKPILVGLDKVEKANFDE